MFDKIIHNMCNMFDKNNNKMCYMSDAELPGVFAATTVFIIVGFDNLLWQC